MVMRKIHSYLCALSVGLLLAACSTEETTDVVNNTNPNQELKLVKVPVNVEAPFGSESETRGMTHDGDGYALYNFDKMVTDGTDLNVLLCLKHKTKGTLVYTSDLTGKLRKTSSGGYALSISNAKVYITEGTNLGEYQVCALLNTGINSETFKSAFIPASGSTSTTVDFSNLPYTDATHSIDGMCVPMYSSYGKSSVDYNATTGSGKITLSFSMMGTVITARVRNNPMAVPIKISKFSLNKSNVRTGEATYTFGKETGGEPAFTFENQTDTCLFEWPKDAARELLPSNEATTTSISSDFWCFPVDKTEFHQQYGLRYELEDNSAINKDDKFNFIKVNGEIKTTGETSAALPTGMESGKCYKVGLELPASDLMITEYEHLNNGTNYSMIEIYNPTNEKKDLRNYGLVRQTGLKQTKRLIGRNRTPDYLAFGDDTETLENARIQDLWINPTTPANVIDASGNENTNYTNSYTLLGQYKDESGNEAYSTACKYVKSINGTSKEFILQPYELGPGQTIVLFAAGTKALTGNVYYPSGSNYFNSNYLTTAITNGDCKYAISVDNGHTSNKGANYNEYNGGVLQAGQPHNFILMKKNGSKFETLDAVFSFDPNDDDMSYWVWNYPENTSQDGEKSDNYRVISRRPSVMYPYTIRRVDDYFNATISAHEASPLLGGIGIGFDWLYRFPNIILPPNWTPAFC
jgi:hypothetical protein